MVDLKRVGFTLIAIGVIGYGVLWIRSQYSPTTAASFQQQLDELLAENLRLAKLLDASVFDTDPKYNNTDFRKRRPSARPELCVAALSCRRYDLLGKTLESVVAHLQQNEPSIDYELVVVDNGQLPENASRFTTDFVAKYQFDKWSVSEANRGVAYGLNALFFGLCSARFVLSLEDDWYFDAGGAANVLRRSMELLTAANDLVGVYLKDLPGGSLSNADEFGTSPATGTYRVLRSPDGGWMFVFANGGVMLDRRKLLRVGPQREVQWDNDGEFDYKKRVCAANLTMAVLADDHRVVQSSMHHMGGDRHVDRESKKRKR